MVLRPYLARALPVHAPAVLDPRVYDAVAECIDVLLEVRRAALALEAYRRVLAARAQRYLHKLESTLRIMAASRIERSAVLGLMGTPRNWAT